MTKPHFLRLFSKLPLILKFASTFFAHNRAAGQKISIYLTINLSGNQIRDMLNSLILICLNSLLLKSKFSVFV